MAAYLDSAERVLGSDARSTVHLFKGQLEGLWALALAGGWVTALICRFLRFLDQNDLFGLT